MESTQRAYWKVDEKLNTVEFDHSFRIEEVGDSKIIRLFPYQIKNRKAFLQRDHPKNLPPTSISYTTYWANFEKKCIEGLWVNDGGTWVFMLPKLFFYINYVSIPIKDRTLSPPELGTLEHIYAAYIMCVDGFSGFAGDKLFTCHYTIKRIGRGEDITESEKRLLPDSVFKEGGGYKTYVDPWEYLTRFYLLDNPQPEPLGEALYLNRLKDFCAIGARGVAKSFIALLMDFLWEWTWGGVWQKGRLLYKNKHLANNKLVFAMGAASATHLQRSLGNVKAFYDKQPGQYKYPDSERHKYMGPFYKKVSGNWKVGEAVNHVVKERSGAHDIVGSALFPSVISPDSKTLGAGDRMRRGLIEEFGFLGIALTVHSINRHSFLVGDTKVGSMFYIGTSGLIESISGPLKLFLNPDVYGIMGIPDYAENVNRNTGLFIPAYYKYRDYSDGEGNLNLKDCILLDLRRRKQFNEEADSQSISMETMFNPHYISELLVSAEYNVLPSKEAGERRAHVQSYNLFNKAASFGSFMYDTTEPYGVRFIKDMKNRLVPITDYNVDVNKSAVDSPFIMYEPPKEYIPDYLYWVSYDPAAQSGEGPSFHGVLVYKWFQTGSDEAFEDIFVGEYLFRKPTLVENYQEVIKIAMYFNAKVFAEINVAGFIDYCVNSNYSHLLQQDAYQLEREHNPRYKSGFYGFGYKITERKKKFFLQKGREWLLKGRNPDPITGVPTKRTLDYIYSLRFLDEVFNYSVKRGNFDLISAFIGVMILIAHLEQSGPVEAELPVKRSEEYLYHTKRVGNIRRRSSFENSMM